MAMGEGQGRARPSLSAAQRELVERHMGLVRIHLRNRVYLPRRATRRRETQDLYQEGYLALVRAAARYDPARDGPFEPFALARIRRDVHKAIHERFTTIRVPLSTAYRHRAAGEHGPGAATAPVSFRTLGDWLDAKRLRIGARDPRGRPSDDAGDGSARAEGENAVVEHLRSKHRIALDAAVERVARHCLRPEARTALRAIVEERVCIASETDRTPMRTIGRRFGISSGRVAAWQQRLEREARALLAGDAEVAILRAAAEPAGDACGGASVDSLPRQLENARLDTFRRALRDNEGRTKIVGFELVLRRAGKDPVAEAAALFARLPCDVQREVLTALHAG